MDFTTIGGLCVGIGLVVFAVFYHEGLQGLTLFWDLPSALITFGGTFSALLVNYPLPRVIGVVKVLHKVFSESQEDTSKIIGTFVTFARKARTDGFLSLETDVKNIDNDFLRRGVRLVIDGQDKEFIQTMLDTELLFIRERHKIGQEMFTALGTYSPAFGIIGTIIGLILMLRKLEDPSQIAGAMAIALLTAVYGLMSAYLVFLPIAGKLRRRSDEEILIKEVIIRGVLLLQSGASPSIVEANLKAYLDPTKRGTSGVRREGIPGATKV